MIWPALRENMIAAWHGVLDYDRKMPRARRATIEARRKLAKAGRMAADAKREQIREKHAQDYQRAMNKVRESSPPSISGPSRRRISDIPADRARCPGCGGPLVKCTRKVNGGIGCLVFLAGLLLTPILIGIPVLIFGIMMMNQKENFWGCPWCEV